MIQSKKPSLYKKEGFFMVGILANSHIPLNLYDNKGLNIINNRI